VQEVIELLHGLWLQYKECSAVYAHGHANNGIAEHSCNQRWMDANTRQEESERVPQIMKVQRWQASLYEQFLEWDGHIAIGIERPPAVV
jgi:hypothetical protein